MGKIYAGFFERFSSASFMYLRVFMCILLLNEQQRINKIYCIFFPPETSTELSKGYTVCVYILWREVLPYSCFRGLYLKWDHINAEQRNMEELKSSYWSGSSDCPLLPHMVMKTSWRLHTHIKEWARENKIITIYLFFHIVFIIVFISFSI